MYQQFKNLLKKLLPRQILYRYESFFRSFYYWVYKGKDYHCNVCNKGLKSFVSLENDDLLCPACGSLSRNRKLWEIINSGYLKNGDSVLDFSPSRNIYRSFKKNAFIKYTSTDLSGDFLSDQKYDITKIETGENAYDLVICYHILEHIIDDNKALSELYRILKPGGRCLIQTPFKEGAIYEDYTITSAEERKKHFGQEDHVRIYSVDGLTQRLISNRFDVEVLEFKHKPKNKYGYKELEFVLACTKKQ